MYGLHHTLSLEGPIKPWWGCLQVLISWRSAVQFYGLLRPARVDPSIVSVVDINRLETQQHSSRGEVR